MHALPVPPVRLVLGPVGLALFLASALALCGCNQGLDFPSDPHVKASDPVAAGRYLVVIGGCNDCHTAGYAEANGEVPESEWLTGTPVGFRGPWGTSYPSNLRLLAQELNEDGWVAMAHTRQGLPPMPWQILNEMSESDARALYRFIHTLGPSGERMPVALTSNQEPTTPYFLFEPQHMERLQPVRLSAASVPAPGASPSKN